MIATYLYTTLHYFSSRLMQCKVYLQTLVVINMAMCYKHLLTSCQACSLNISFLTTIALDDESVIAWKYFWDTLQDVAKFVLGSKQYYKGG